MCCPSLFFISFDSHYQLSFIMVVNFLYIVVVVGFRDSTFWEGVIRHTEFMIVVIWETFTKQKNNKKEEDISYVD